MLRHHGSTVSQLLIGLAITMIVTVAPQISASASPASDLQGVIDAYWQANLRDDPFAATSAGEHAYNDKSPDVSAENKARKAETAEQFLKSLKTIDKNKLTARDRTNANLLEFILSHDVALAPFQGWRMPILADTGFHSDISYVVGATPFRNANDYETYLKRLKTIPTYLNQNIENMRLGLKTGFTQPREILDNILPSFEGQVSDTPQEHPLFDPFTNMPDSIGKRQQNRLRKIAADILATEIIPAYAEALTFMKEEYLPGARASLGASALPDGDGYYRALVRFYTTRDDASPEDIHRLGLREVKRIRNEMNKVIKETGFKGGFASFIEFLRTDPQFYAKTEIELLRHASAISKEIDGRLPGFFAKIPRQPYSVEPVPDEIAANYTTGRYVGAPADSDRGGQYWVNTYGLDTRPLYELPALTLHEAMPGHHFQAATALEIKDVPAFRKQFYPHAFGEGWGLYAEKLGIEMGVYKTPYEQFGRLSYEMWRACRLVIDTGIHSKQWTRQQAIDYLASNTALSLHNVRTEVDRYIAWPGQALAYKVGELTIWELRERATRALGDKFDLRTFHDAILSDGGMPMDLLSEKIDDYIAAQKSPKPTNETVLRRDTSFAENLEIIVQDLKVPANTAIAKHLHPGEEIAYIIDGALRLETEQEGDRLITEGETIFIEKQTEHAPVTGDETMRAIIIRIHPKGEPVRIEPRQ